MYNVFILCLITFVHSLPLMTDKEAMKYLQKYGYMSDGQNETDFREALKSFQSFMGLPQNGRMTEECSRIMRLPRCGLPDISPGTLSPRQRRYALQGSRWKRRNTFTYRVVKYSQKLNRTIIDREIQEAFDLWARYINITFTPTTMGAFDIGVAFYLGEHQDSGPFDGPDGILAHAFYPVFGGHIHFDESEEWTSAEHRGVNLKNVAAHEIGHSLGMLHSRDKEALMFPTYEGYDTKLNQDDINGITKLYS